MEVFSNDTKRFMAVFRDSQLGAFVFNFILAPYTTKFQQIGEETKACAFAYTCKAWRILTWQWREEERRNYIRRAMNHYHEGEKKVLYKVILRFGIEPRVTMLAYADFQKLPLLEYKRRQNELKRGLLHNEPGPVHVKQAQPSFTEGIGCLLPVSAWEKGRQALQSSEARTDEWSHPWQNWFLKKFAIENELEDDESLGPFFMSTASYLTEEKEWCKYVVTYNLQTKAFEKGVPPNVDGIVPVGHVIDASTWKFEDSINRADRYIPTKIIRGDKRRQFPFDFFWRAIHQCRNIPHWLDVNRALHCETCQFEQNVRSHEVDGVQRLVGRFFLLVFFVNNV